ncbi:hypothetical protein FSARC_9111 [Fusarium sarcochroum]|uniref:Uncharacterized protein n=1 Tax=Fusarium sarcochroum TaxID=1208366 RepID=A0A8H4TRU0_9HYPO|nr:hypothetical protein FSARC_9111 [Fusarium sarcochroum]
MPSESEVVTLFREARRQAESYEDNWSGAHIFDTLRPDWRQRSYTSDEYYLTKEAAATSDLVEIERDLPDLADRKIILGCPDARIGDRWQLEPSTASKSCIALTFILHFLLDRQSFGKGLLVASVGADVPGLGYGYVRVLRASRRAKKSGLAHHLFQTSMDAGQLVRMCRSKIV